LIVKYDEGSGIWEDELGRNWNNGVRFFLPDEDVFAIDADTLGQIALHKHVGTTLFNMAVNPSNGDLYVSNTESINEVRFEGPGVVGGSTVQGHLAESRITVIDNPNKTDGTGASVKPRHLNKHIDYGTLAADLGFDETAREHSLATPVEMVVDSTGATLYVAAFGSSKVGVFDTASLEADTFDPTVDSGGYFPVSGGGPSGLVLDEGNGRLYVLTRFDNSVSILNAVTGLEEDHISLHNPEPVDVTAGRPFLYDAFHTSGNGEASCASCHIFGDMDHIAWDLGNPDDVVTNNPGNIRLAIGAGPSVNGGAAVNQFHPMKGPMTTQTLRGMQNSGAMHWRGDRADGFFGSGLDEALSFNNFIVAFEGAVAALVGHVVAAVERTGPWQGPAPVVVWGGLLAEGGPLRSRVLRALERPGIHHREGRLDPPAGAARLAFRGL
jgi:DNA-binding beta-propeller fold protein YncE